MPTERELPAVTKNRNYPQPVKQLKPMALGRGALPIFSLPSRGNAVDSGRWGRSEDFGGRIWSVSYGAVAALYCCTSLPSLTLNRQRYSGERDGPL